MVKAIGLLSGGLDSMLAVKVVQEQGITVLGLSFTTPFFAADKARSAAEVLGIDLEVMDITGEHLEMVKDPPHGYGRNMNPCIDCHAMMFNHAGRLMEKTGSDFLFSGEVLGERPMSQNRQALATVARSSGYGDYILRPLSARLLPVTAPEEKGLVNRDLLLELSGRSRKPQIELAARYGFTNYPTPAGGCLLTDPGFSARLRDLKEKEPSFTARDVEFLKVGRQFRLPGGAKLVVGRKHAENERLLELARGGDIVIKAGGYVGPVCVIPGGAAGGDIEKAASICLRYSDAPGDEEALVEVRRGGDVRRFRVRPCDQADVDSVRIRI